MYTLSRDERVALLDPERWRLLSPLRALLVAQPDGTLCGGEIGATRSRSPLGSGGMGTVWLARCTDDRFEGRAAVKLDAGVTAGGQPYLVLD